MSTNKFWKHGGAETCRYLLCLTLTFFVSMIVAPEFYQAFAGENVHGVIITDGWYPTSTQFRMSAQGKDRYSHYQGGGDWTAEVVDVSEFRISGTWVKYLFKVPAELYDHRLIKKIEVAFHYNDVDYGDSFYPAVFPFDEDLKPTFSCWDYDNKEWDKWRDLSAPHGWDDVTTPGIYTDDDQYHIGGTAGEEYVIALKFNAPDGAGGAPEDDDAEVDVSYMEVTLILKQQHPPGLQHTSPAKGSNDKVNVPISTSTRFTVQADDPEASGYPIREYHWNKQLIRTPLRLLLMTSIVTAANLRKISTFQMSVITQFTLKWSIRSLKILRRIET